MTYASIAEIKLCCVQDLGHEAGARYCERIAQSAADKRVSIDYAEAARQLRGIGPSRERLAVVFDATGIPWRWAWSVNHLGVAPISNLRPWSEQGQAALEAAAVSVGGQITYRLVRHAGRCIEEFPAAPGRGFRVY